MRLKIIYICIYIYEEEEAWRQLHKNAASNMEQVLEAAPHKAAAVRPLTTHHENYPSQKNQTCGTCKNSYETYSCGSPHMDEQKQDG